MERRRGRCVGDRRSSRCVRALVRKLQLRRAGRRPVRPRHAERGCDVSPSVRIGISPDSGFPLENLPYGAFVRDTGEAPRLGVALGEAIVDVQELARAGLFDETLDGARAVLSAANVNPLLARGVPAWKAVRARLAQLLRAGNDELQRAGIADSAFVFQRDVAMALPLAVGDYVDFYSSLEHATNLGRIMRPDGEPLLPNWRWLPIGYHGRAGTVVPSGTPIVRPCGQTKAPTAKEPTYGPTRMLDFELELAFVTGDGPPLGTRIPAEHARECIFGVALLNDWSARDIQGWEYQPLGPFLAKSFASSLGSWIVPLEALEPYRVEGPRQEPPAMSHLAASDRQNYDIGLEATLTSARMREDGIAPLTITRTNFRDMYWSMAQQLAHATSNGARVRAGDLFGSGTISGRDSGSYGSLIELTWRGAHPLTLPDGTQRAFLEDGDELTLHGVAASAGKPRISLGSVRGIVLPS
ncbi:MAG: fumarylacetoacetase [Candidatus Eremiobacteraeota bacterium]|nr:fumarylacetoacetase [Candidatus Eremiobacteraeota bacterium]MBC5820742.1 fumarylacetoacetase [Candidatus Eremiobacteraeota bacterium]